MKCSRCRNSIKSIHQCDICKQNFCSEDCLISHSTLYHQSNISSPIMTHSLNNNNSFFINRKDYNLSAKKLLSKIDKDKENQYMDKTESIFNMLYVYRDIAEEKLNQFNDDESDEEPDI